MNFRYVVIFILSFLSFAMLNASFSEVPNSKQKLAYAIHVYDLESPRRRENSDRLLGFVKEISLANALTPVIFKSARRSEVTKYRVLTFSKDLDNSGNYRVSAFGDGNESVIWEKVPTTYTKLVDDLVRDISLKAHVINSYTNAYASSGGGVSYGARNLPGIKSISLVCKSEIFSDGSGGSRCSTRADKIDLSALGIIFEKYNGASSVEEIEKLPWPKSAFDLSLGHIEAEIQLFKIN